MTTVTSSIDQFLNAFFGPGNDLRLGPDANSPVASSLRPWVDRLRETPPQPTILPRRNGSQFEYYAVAFDTGQFQLMEEDLRGFLGATWVQFRGGRETLSNSDPVDLALAAMPDLKLLRFLVPDNSTCRSEAGRALRLMRQAWERRRVVRSDCGELERPVGRLLRDFFMALRASNRDTAEVWLHQLQTQGALDPSNMLVLRVQMLAELGLWSELLAIDELPILAVMQCPPVVSEAVLTAIYIVHVANSSKTGAPQQVVETFRSQAISMRFAAWFASIAGIRRPEALTVLLLYLLTQSPANFEQAQRVLTEIPADALERPLLRYLKDLAGTPTTVTLPSDALETAKSLVALGDWDGASTAAKVAPRSFERTCILYECAATLKTLEHRRLAVESLGTLSESDRDRFLTSPAYRILAQSLEHENFCGVAVVTDVDSLPPRSWDEWLDRLNRAGPWRGANDQARAGATQWTVESFLGNEESVQTFVEALGASRTPQADRVLDDALPHLLRTLQGDPQYPRSEFRSLYQRTMEVLLLMTEGARDDLAVLLDLLEAFLSLGVSRTEYDLILTDLRDLFDRIASPVALDSTLDQLDLLAQMPCPNTANRDEFVTAVATWCLSHPRRISKPQWRWLTAICEELGQTAVLANLPQSSVESGTGEAMPVLDGKLVAIYTLTEAVGRHLARRLQQLFAGVRVELAHDLVASDRLRQLARTADLFIMFTRSAKHAATDCIRQARPRQSPLVMPTGRGVSAVLQLVCKTMS